MRMSRIGLAVLLTAYAACAAAAIYKWVDRDGVTHYSETPPPPEVQTKELAIPTAPSAPAAAEPATAAAPGAPAAPSSEADKEKLAKSRAVQCAQVKDTLHALNSGGPLYTSNSAGDQVLLTQADREEALERWKKLEEKYCPPQE